MLDKEHLGNWERRPFGRRPTLVASND